MSIFLEEEKEYTKKLLARIEKNIEEYEGEILKMETKVIGGFVKFDSWVNISQIKYLSTYNNDDEYFIGYKCVGDTVTHQFSKSFISRKEVEKYIEDFLKKRAF